MTKRRLLSAFLILIVFALSCRKSSDNSTETTENANQLLKQAKDYFYEQHPPLSLKGTASQSTSESRNELVAMWRRCYVSKTSQMEFVEVPVAKPGQSVNLYNFANQPGNSKTNLMRVTSSLHRLLLYKKDGGQFQEVVLTYIPTYEYLEKKQI